MVKGKATPACPGMECPSHYLMSVSPGGKLRNQDVKTLPAASERAREEWISMWLPRGPGARMQSRRQRLPIQLRAGAKCPGPGRTKRGFWR